MTTYDITYLIIGIMALVLLLLLWTGLFPFLMNKPTKNDLKYDWRYRESEMEKIKINPEHLNNVSIGDEHDKKDI